MTKTKRRPASRRWLLVLVLAVTMLLVAVIWFATLPPVNPMYPVTPCYVATPNHSARDRMTGVWGCLQMATMEGTDE